MKIKKFFITLLISLIIMPTSVFAYSDKLIVGGQNIGIEVKTKGILVVGLYKVNDTFIAESSGIKTGDYITKMNNKTVNSIEDFTKEINKNSDKNKILIEYSRDNKSYTTTLNLTKVDNEYKTGLYVKDTINGIGTLTFIDPVSKSFGALGHEIQEKESKKQLTIEDGSIYYSYITGINKSTNGVPGEKEAKTDNSKIYGEIKKNTINGIFGNYTNELDDSNLYPVASLDDVKMGDAQIYTVTDGETITSYSINIEKINKDDDTKNILFTITDKSLMEKTGGIVQGMSGSPIIQNGNIIGAVTHVVVDNCKKGYGVSIINMLEELEK